MLEKELALKKLIDSLNYLETKLTVTAIVIVIVMSLRNIQVCLRVLVLLIDKYLWKLFIIIIYIYIWFIIKEENLFLF